MSGFSKVEMSAFFIHPRYPRGMETLTLSYGKLDRVSVIERVVEKQLTQVEAARMLGLTSRQVRRLRQAYERDGPIGLASKHRGRPSNPRLSAELRREALAIVRSRYADFGPTLAHEKLTELHGLKFSVETLRYWMIEDGRWVPRAFRESRIQQPRRRRPCRGELIPIDGSDHEWFEDRASRCTLLVFDDDATSQSMELLFCDSESLFSCFRALRSYLGQHGKPVALYSDKASVLRINRKEPEGGAGVTQFSRALRSLNIDIICANTPAAKGRVERAHLTLQDRLVKELRLRQISDIASANAYVSEFVADYNRRFARSPRSEHDAHRPMQPADDLDRIFSLHETRMVSKSLMLNYQRVLYVLDPTDAAQAARKQRVSVEEREDGSGSFWHGEHELAAMAFPRDSGVRQGDVVANKHLSSTMDLIRERQRQRAEERITKPSTTLRDARLLREGTPRRTATRAPAETQPRQIKRGKADISILGKTGYFYIGTTGITFEYGSHLESPGGAVTGLRFQDGGTSARSDVCLDIDPSRMIRAHNSSHRISQSRVPCSPRPVMCSVMDRNTGSRFSRPSSTQRLSTINSRSRIARLPCHHSFMGTAKPSLGL